jgi:hypothetical protein
MTRVEPDRGRSCRASTPGRSVATASDDKDADIELTSLWHGAGDFDEE